MNLEQHYFSNSPIDKSTLDKIAKYLVKEILTIASFKLNKDPSHMTVLDVGSGCGLYSEKLSKKCKKVIGVEPYKKAYNISCRKTKKNLLFYNSKIEDLNIKDRFDLVLSLTSLEHMPDAEASFQKIFTVLKPHGLIYLTAPNKLWPFEPHYKLPFLSYLPLPLANIYMRIMKKGTSYEDSSYAKTYFGIQKLLNKFPCIYEF